MSSNPNLQFTFQNDFVNSKRLIFTAGIHLSHPAAPQPFPLADPRAAGFWVGSGFFLRGVRQFVALVCCVCPC